MQCNKLNEIFQKSNKINITDSDRFVIFSDLHMGNGGFNDDFSKNSDLFLNALSDYYIPKGYNLVLNGDVEELYKFSYKNIMRQWERLYEIFDLFNNEGRLYKIFGNHDYELILNPNLKKIYPVTETLRLDYKGNDIFIYHGHQTGNMLERYSKIMIFLIKYLFRNINNPPVNINKTKRYAAETIAYKFSVENRIISILGHTHRPLFESLSRIDYLNHLIEKLINKYHRSGYENSEIVIRQIQKYKDELDHINKNYNKKSHFTLRNSIYNNNSVIPCLFNSGAVTGKRGLTGIEIKNGKIALVYWFDSNRSSRYLNYKGVKNKRLSDTDYYRAVLKKESLDYIFTRIKLLS